MCTGRPKVNFMLLSSGDLVFCFVLFLNSISCWHPGITDSAGREDFPCLLPRLQDRKQGTMDSF